MKKSPTLCRTKSIAEADRGTALVIVLGMLVLLVALTVGFLLLVSTERGASASYAHAAGASRLAETCVELVQAQIEHATTQAGNSTWVSQPGMIRTFEENGTFQTAYKLYSASALTTSDAASLPGPDLPPINWADFPSAWTDINAPTISDGTAFFPILNPAANGLIPGFSVDSDRLTPDALAMPVRWLYVLADGKIVTPVSANGGSVLFDGPMAPTENNPIVGRIAFWTDDESCKVNVNTAGAPNFFDIPWYNSTQEKSLADTQPVRGEFQRYPGHPATVDLTTVIAPILSGFTQREIQKEVLDLVPRLKEGGSTYATVRTRSDASPIIPDDDRLLSSSDELFYAAEVPLENKRTPGTRLSASELDLLCFFLTAHSRTPELNPFGLPKIACWPLSIIDSDSHRTAFERLIARCASINGSPYFFQRANAKDPERDWEDIPRNRDLFRYLNTLLSEPLPGAGSSFQSKFREDQPQILAQILDYIRSTNLYDEYLPTEANRFTNAKASPAGIPEAGHGFVAPLRIKPEGGGEFAGFGRFFTLSELAFLFICNADGYDINNDGADSNGDGEDRDVADPSPYPWAGGALNTPALRLPYENFERKRSRYGMGYPADLRDPPGAPDNAAVPSGTMLAPNERRVQMLILPELFSSMYGYGILRPDMSITITGLSSITLNGQPIFPRDSETVEITSSYQALHTAWPLGGPGGFRQALVHTRDAGTPRHVAKSLPSRGDIPADSGAGDPASTYALVSEPLTITIPPGETSPTMVFSPGSLTVEIYSGAESTGGRKLVQSIPISGPSANIPVPKLVAFPDHARETRTEAWWGFHKDGVVSGHPGRIHHVQGKRTGSDNQHHAGIMVRGHGRPENTGSNTSTSGTYVKDTDVIRSFVPAHGDYRLIAARSSLPPGVFIPLGDWNEGTFLLHALHDANWNAKSVPGAIDYFGKYRNAITSYGLVSTAERKARFPDFPLFSTHTPNETGDYDKGPTYAIDGPYVNKPDEGNIYASNALEIPYFPTTTPDRQQFEGERFFSPNRVMPSPGMFGSLPSHVMRNVPWRTLLFRPQENHPNFSDPKDHLVMEFFWMPVVEPYAISEPFSTAGKINMNHQIMPFPFIQRSTGLFAALSEERVTAAPLAAAEFYNLPDSDQTAFQRAIEYRRKIDPVETLRQFQDRFDAGGIFLSASEICDLYLVPEGESVEGMPAFWEAHSLTSDNIRERVYTTLYPKLTVRSNVFTVHHKVQVLKKRAGSDPSVWDETGDQVVAEYRGAATIERFLDPNDSRIPDYPGNANPLALPRTTEFYRWRTIRNLPFSP